MKNSFSPIAVALLFGGSLAAANAADTNAHWYLKPQLGVSLVDSITTVTTDSLNVTRTTTADFDAGIRFDYAVGYQIDKSWAVEGEIGFIYNSLSISTSAAVDSPALYQIPLLFSGIYTLPLEGRLKPYVGLGIGLVFSGLDDVGKDVAGAGQIVAGAKYELNDHCELSLGYKFLITTEHDWIDFFGSTQSTRTMTHALQAAFTYKF